MRRACTMFLTALLGVVFSGCASDNGGTHGVPSDSTGYAPPTFTEHTGAVQGTVTDDSLAPLGGAHIASDILGMMTVSDPAGRFAFSNLVPGSIVLFVTAAGYEPTATTVVVSAGTVTSVNVYLVPLPSDEPYHVLTPYHGNLGCEGYVNATIDRDDITSVSCNQLGYTSKRSWWTASIKNGTRFDTFVAELTWRSTQTLGSELRMSQRIVASNNSKYDFALDVPGDTRKGPSPLRFMISNDTLDARVRQINETGGNFGKTLQGKLSGAPDYKIYTTMWPARTSPGITLALDQRFTLYVTLFYGDPAPPDYTAIPDS